MTDIASMADLVRRYVAQKKFGLNPYDPAVNKAQDVGLGGVSTEFLSSEEDLSGTPFNYPNIWWDKAGNPMMLEGDASRDQALAYEEATGKRFPRIDTFGQAEFAAMNRSARGGGDSMPLATLFGARSR